MALGSRFRALGLVVALVCGAPAAHAADGIRLPDLDGRLVDPLDLSDGATAVVALFVSVDCPVSNRYAPELQRIHQRFLAEGVRFLLVYPNPAESPAAIRRHLESFGHPGQVLRDPDHAFVRAAGMSITPEVAVFDRAGVLAYRGRIDDRYVSLGVERPAPTRRDLHEALTATLAGRPVELARTDAVGCFIADFAHIH